jgi:hypothetical protein
MEENKTKALVRRQQLVFKDRPCCPRFNWIVLLLNASAGTPNCFGIVFLCISIETVSITAPTVDVCTMTRLNSYSCCQIRFVMR